MNYLVIGSGGREHALAWKLGCEEGTDRVYAAPGNDGMSADSDAPIEAVDIEPSAFGQLANFADQKAIDLTVVGPEGPLCDGIVDFFRERNLAIFGPERRAARLEGSKSYAKEIMKEAGVPTADFEVFEELEAALEYVEAVEHPVAVKADGLAGGKGVVVSREAATSRETLVEYMGEGRFGEASRRVVIEEGLVGEEMSFIVLTDGEQVVELATSRDHKRVGEGETGPNTGGMGAVAPAPDITPELGDEIMEEIIAPTLAELRRRGIEYRGFLYAGLMLTEAGPKVLEFNCRMGDPEAQPLLFALRDDLGPVLADIAAGSLSEGVDLRSDRYACCVVLASGGYPAPNRDTGHVISGLEDAAGVPETKLFHAGTALENGDVLNVGGRVLGVTGRGTSSEQARKRAYDAASSIDWKGMHYRSDIGE